MALLFFQTGVLAGRILFESPGGHKIKSCEFGSSLFFRSTERPKSFLVPVSDYEILEQKEMKLPLKNVSIDRSIKIGDY